MSRGGKLTPRALEEIEENPFKYHPVDGDLSNAFKSIAATADDLSISHAFHYVDGRCFYGRTLHFQFAVRWFVTTST